MNQIVDIEIIKSALLFGEPSDAVKRIESRKKSIEKHVRMGGKKYPEYLKFLQLLEDYLKGVISIDKLRDFLRAEILFPIEEYDSFVESFVYYCEYCRDRYNLRYPDFDGKRCDDL
ncbi:MAG: hypothetical protein ACYDAO_03735 [Thermoplasmataceae archaeon]